MLAEPEAPPRLTLPIDVLGNWAVPKVAVLWPVESDAPIFIADWIKRKGEQVRGNALETRRAQVISSNVAGVSEGDTAVIRCDAACLIIDDKDYPWVPNGFEVRIYGLDEPLWSPYPKTSEQWTEDVVLYVERP